MKKERIIHLLDMTLECRKLKGVMVSFQIDDREERIHIYTSKPVKGITSTFYYSSSTWEEYTNSNVMALTDIDLVLAEKHMELLLNDPKYAPEEGG